MAVIPLSCQFCNNKLMESYQLEGLVVPNEKKVPICPSIQKNCCTVNDMMKLHQMSQTNLKIKLDSNEFKFKTVVKGLAKFGERILKWRPAKSLAQKLVPFCRHTRKNLQNFKFKLLVYNLRTGHKDVRKNHAKVHQSFLCTFCDHKAHPFVNVVTNVIDQDRDACLMLLSQTDTFMMAQNYELIRYFQAVVDYLDCNGFEKEFNLPFPWFNKKVIADQMKECSDQRTEDPANKACLSICGHLGIGTHSPVFEGDADFIEKALAYFSSTLHKIRTSHRRLPFDPLVTMVRLNSERGNVRLSNFKANITNVTREIQHWSPANRWTHPSTTADSRYVNDLRGYHPAELDAQKYLHVVEMASPPNNATLNGSLFQGNSSAFNRVNNLMNGGLNSGERAFNNAKGVVSSVGGVVGNGFNSGVNSFRGQPGGNSGAFVGPGGDNGALGGGGNGAVAAGDAAGAATGGATPGEATPKEPAEEKEAAGAKEPKEPKAKKAGGAAKKAAGAAKKAGGAAKKAGGAAKKAAGGAAKKAGGAAKKAGGAAKKAAGGGGKKKGGKKIRALGLESRNQILGTRFNQPIKALNRQKKLDSILFEGPLGRLAKSIEPGLFAQRKSKDFGIRFNNPLIKTVSPVTQQPSRQLSESEQPSQSQQTYSYVPESSDPVLQQRLIQRARLLEETFELETLSNGHVRQRILSSPEKKKKDDKNKEFKVLYESLVFLKNTTTPEIFAVDSNPFNYNTARRTLIAQGGISLLGYIKTLNFNIPYMELMNLLVSKQLAKGFELEGLLSSHISWKKIGSDCAKTLKAGYFSEIKKELLSFDDESMNKIKPKFEEIEKFKHVDLSVFRKQILKLATNDFDEEFFVSHRTVPSLMIKPKPKLPIRKFQAREIESESSKPKRNLKSKYFNY